MKRRLLFGTAILVVRESGNSSDIGYPNHGVILKLSTNAFIKALQPSKSLRLYTLKNQYILISKKEIQDFACFLAN